MAKLHRKFTNAPLSWFENWKVGIRVGLEHVAVIDNIHLMTDSGDMDSTAPCSKGFEYRYGRCYTTCSLADRMVTPSMG